MSDKITFNQLKLELAARAGQPGMPSAAQSANAQSALKAFWAERGFHDDDIVGASLRADYLTLRETHIAATKAGRNRRWLLNFAARLVSVLDHESALAAHAPTPLQIAVRALIPERSRTITPTARKIGVSPRTLMGWLTGIPPQRTQISALSRLEDVFELTPGALTGLLPVMSLTRREMRASAKDLPRDEYLEQSSNLRDDAYFLPIAVMEQHRLLRRQWEALLEDKVRGAERGTDVAIVWTEQMVTERADTSEAELKNPWRLRALRDGEEPRWFDCVGSNRVPTGDMYFDRVRMLLGWASVPVASGGAGLPVDSLSLALLADASLVKRFFAWRVARRRRPTKTDTDFLKNVMALLSAETGYVARTWSLGASVGIADEAAWRIHCAEARAKIAETAKKFKRLVRISRDTEANLRAVLELPEPMSALIRGVQRLAADHAAYTGKNAPCHARDLLLLTLPMSNPLRVGNLSAMTYRKDNTGELRRRSDGSWRIFIDRSKMKNINGAAKDRDYDQPVDPAVWPLIEAYLRVRDQFNPSKYLFAPLLGRSHRLFLREQVFSDKYRDLTMRYVPELPRGTGIHGIRHIRATHEIVTHGDYVHAAYLLHDEIETTREHYAHLLNAFHERQRALRGTTSALGAVATIRTPPSRAPVPCA